MPDAERPGRTRSPGEPPLVEALGVILPTEAQTLLLQACLLPGADGRRAWAGWLGRVGDPKRALARETRGTKALLPFVYDALQRTGTPVDRGLLPYLRAAYFREQLRGRTCRRICVDVLSRLAQVDVPAVLLTEAALAAGVYGDWALRHCHQIDLLVDGDDVSRAAEALIATRCAPSGSSRGSTVSLKHASDLPVLIHGSLSGELAGAGRHLACWNPGEDLAIDGVQAHVLAPADALLHLCGWISAGHDRLLQGTCDAWHLIARSPDLDWPGLVHALGEHHLAGPAYVVLRYVARDLGAPIPPDALDELRAIAWETDALGQDIALRAARFASGGFGPLLHRTPRWGARARIVRAMLLPSPAYIRSTEGVRRSWLLPWYYVRRPLRFLARRGRALLSRQNRSESPARTRPDAG
jgi:hypothetical protein